VLRLNVDKYNVLYKKKGKQVAEKVLINISKIIGGTIRKEDTLVRVGLDKFAILMPGADERSSRKIAEKIHIIMQKTGYKIGNTRFRMTISAGLVTPTISEGLDFEEILHVAEARLNNAISQGGNCLIFEEDRLSKSKKKAVKKGALRPVQRQELTIDEALVLINANETAKVKEQLLPLIEEVYPLIHFANKELRLGLDGSVIQLQDRIETLKKGG
jgi:diguanylate cyclase (GGDEF)-like protein